MIREADNGRAACSLERSVVWTFGREAWALQLGGAFKKWILAWPHAESK